MKCRTTRPELIKLLERFIDLADDEQIDLNCPDSKDLYDKVREELKIDQIVDNVRLIIDLEAFELPPNVVWYEEGGYDISIEHNSTGKELKIHYVTIEDSTTS